MVQNEKTLITWSKNLSPIGAADVLTIGFNPSIKDV